MPRTIAVETNATGTAAQTKPSTAVSFVRTVRSADGTTIAFERAGNGPSLILIDGALCYRGLGQTKQLAELLGRHFTVFTYDRRGRGESGDTVPYAMDREVDDIAAVMDEAGGSAFVWGMSSGAVLALEAANRLRGIEKVALYEAPLVIDSRDSRDDSDNSHSSYEHQWNRIGEAVAADKRTEALKLFMRMVGVPGYFIAMMRLLPVWSKLKAIAHTLVYDGAIVRDYQRGAPLPAHIWASVTVPTLVLAGGKSPAWMRHGNDSLARVLPNAQYRTLDGQTHMLKPQAHVPALVEFLGLKLEGLNS